MTETLQDTLNKALVKTAAQGKAEQLALLLRQGASPDAGAGTTPALFVAAAGNHAACIRLLLAAGAKVDVTNSKGSTPLMVAAFNANLKAMRLLLDAGADRNLKNRDGADALKFAQTRESSEAIALLKEDADEIIQRSRLGDRMLEEIFNFRTLERISLVRKGVGQPIEALYRESFTQIEDLPALREAFQQHRQRGGKRSEQDVFPHGLSKAPVLQRRPK
jgi:ankyrin repeat protein